ncbi:MAG: hypothetical protein R3C68_09320 [Myxococcota bacterium]
MFTRTIFMLSFATTCLVTAHVAAQSNPASSRDNPPPPPVPESDVAQPPDSQRDGDTPNSDDVGETIPPMPSKISPTESREMTPNASPSAAGDNDVTLEEWNRNDWMLVKPELSLVDLSGYMRLRGRSVPQPNFETMDYGSA